MIVEVFWVFENSANRGSKEDGLFTKNQAIITDYHLCEHFMCHRQLRRQLQEINSNISDERGEWYTDPSPYDMNEVKRPPQNFLSNNETRTIGIGVCTTIE